MSDEATEEVREIWEAVAPGWERHRQAVFEQQRAVSERLIQAVDASDGDTILELTAGPGETGLLLAEQTPKAQVVISDFAPRMVKAAETAARARNLTNVECRQIDAQEIDLPDDSVQGVLSRYGLMLIPNLEAAFSEIRRVLTPGGSLAYAVWGPLEANAWMMLFGAAFIQHGHFTPPEGGFFPLTTADENRSMLESAGFGAVSVEVLDNTMNFASTDQYWELNSSVSGPLALIAQGLSSEQVTAVRSSLEDFVAPFKTDSEIALPAQSLVVQASVA